MRTRRTIVWIVSAIVGLVSSAGVILLFGTTLQRFTVVNALLVFLGMGSIAFIWLDWILRTKFLQT